LGYGNDPAWIYLYSIGPPGGAFTFAINHRPDGFGHLIRLKRGTFLLILKIIQVVKRYKSKIPAFGIFIMIILVDKSYGGRGGNDDIVLINEISVSAIISPLDSRRMHV
jgi:hypothetical protein